MRRDGSDWAYMHDGKLIYVPDTRLDVVYSDESLIPLRGYRYVRAVMSGGKCRGYVCVDESGNIEPKED